VDERAIKRLVVTVLVSIVVIMVLKTMLLKMASVKATRAVPETKRVVSPVAQPEPAAASLEIPAASTVNVAPAMDATAVSGAYEAGQNAP